MYRRRPTPQKKSWRAVMLSLLVISVVGGIWFGTTRKADAPVQSEQTASEPQTSQESVYVPADLQPIIDTWISKQSAEYHIAVYDVRSQTLIGSHQADTSRFAASLYKLFVAYAALQDFQSGEQNPDAILITGHTKRACVDKMIRSSDSPCGEAMMAEIGQSQLNERVESWGMTGTFFNGIRTSARDTTKILQYIAEKRDLNDENTTFLLDAMRTQDAKFKRGLQTGAPDANWETKVGWNEDSNYHDVGIMTLPDGRKFAVSILSQGQGSSAPIADFAKTIYTELTQ